jgi:hypothetical protein
MDPLSSSGAATTANYQIAVASKALDITRQQGEEAVSLIQSAGPAPAAQGSLGRLVNVRA